MPVLVRPALLLLALALLETIPTVVRAHGRRDPLVTLENQKRRTEERKQKRREEHDLQGAETRDTKKSAQDSHQSETQSQTGTPNERTNTWFGF